MTDIEKDALERRMVRPHARVGSGGGLVLVEVSIPLEVVGRVECGHDGEYYVEVMGQEVDTDEDTYWRVIRARESHCMHEIEIEVNE